MEYGFSGFQPCEYAGGLYDEIPGYTISTVPRSRRSPLRSMVVAAVSLPFSGCSGFPSPSSRSETPNNTPPPTFNEWLGGTRNDESIVANTNCESDTIDVGDTRCEFDPPAVWFSQGAMVVWRWAEGWRYKIEAVDDSAPSRKSGEYRARFERQFARVGTCRCRGASRMKGIVKVKPASETVEPCPVGPSPSEFEMNREFGTLTAFNVTN